jgi:hypothetical protein
MSKPAVWPFAQFKVAKFAKVIFHSPVWKDGDSPAKMSADEQIEQ